MARKTTASDSKYWKILEEISDCTHQQFGTPVHALRLTTGFSATAEARSRMRARSFREGPDRRHAIALCGEKS
jgi:hypothetical protein